MMIKETLKLPGMISVCVIALLTCLVMLLMQMPAQAAAECSRIFRVSGYETLVNTCNECRSVAVIRTRGGNGSPTRRTYQLTKNAKFPLPFKGTGRTVIDSDVSCGPNQPSRKDKESLQANVERCVRPVQTKNGIIMSNGCGECRSIIVERSYPDGKQLYKPYNLEGKGFIGLLPEGALTAEIVKDMPC